ncbi:MAG: hypothetical protein HY900_07550 [Deltaproteobacteria bacterium]|nr:hypothetical protein [Deltaproteobacteria bacterium]
MKKLLILGSALFLFACAGGGGGGSSPVGDNGPGNTGGNPVDQPGGSNQGGSFSISLPPQQSGAARIVSGAGGFIRNHARLVALKVVTTTTTIPGYDVNCTDVGTEDEVCTYTPNPSKDQTVTTTKTDQIAVGDAELDPLTGSGSVSISLPPGSDYTLHLLTYHQATVGGVTTNYMLHAAESNPVTIASGSTPVVTFKNWNYTANPVPAIPAIAATLHFKENADDATDASLIVAKDTYYLTLTDKSPVLAESFYGRAVAESSLDGNNWFIHEETDTGDVYGRSPLRMTAPTAIDSTAPYNYITLTARGQFVISTYFLQPLEQRDQNSWVFDTAAFTVPFAPLADIEIGAP